MKEIENYNDYDIMLYRNRYVPLAKASSAETPPKPDDNLGRWSSVKGVSALRYIPAWPPVVFKVRFLLVCAAIVRWPSSRIILALKFEKCKSNEYTCYSPNEILI